MTQRNFKCAACAETFDMGRPDDVAEAEFAELFPGESLSEAELVCDDCWEAMGGREAAEAYRDGKQCADEPVNLDEWMRLSDADHRRLILDAIERTGDSPMVSAVVKTARNDDKLYEKLQAAMFEAMLLDIFGGR